MQHAGLLEPGKRLATAACCLSLTVEAVACLVLLHAHSQFLRQDDGLLQLAFLQQNNQFGGAVARFAGYLKGFTVALLGTFLLSQGIVDVRQLRQPDALLCAPAEQPLNLQRIVGQVQGLVQ